MSIKVLMSRVELRISKSVIYRSTVTLSAYGARNLEGNGPNKGGKEFLSDRTQVLKRHRSERPC